MLRYSRKWQCNHYLLTLALSHIRVKKKTTATTYLLVAPAEVAAAVALAVVVAAAELATGVVLAAAVVEPDALTDAQVVS